jgi:arylsulfatase A-like enzyme
MVKCIDDNVGKILAALRGAGLLEKTIVVFSSDHGDMCGEHGRHNKGIPLEASAKIPLLIYAPGKVKPGMVVHEALATVDFKPTILGLLGVASEGGDEGRNASALFLNGKAPAGWNDVAISRHAGGIWLMAASSRYKFIVSTDSDPCLFDLDQDAFEMRNIFRLPSSRETVRTLARALLDYSRKCNEPFAVQPAMQADLVWAAEGTGSYASPKREAAERNTAKKGGRKAGKKKKAADEDEP